MASAEQHQAQALRNESVADRLAALGEFEWAITCLFYASLHLIQAYLRQSDVTTTNHFQREWQMRRTPLLVDIPSYRLLKTYSENARYECEDFSESEFLSLRDEEYAPLAGHIREQVSFGG